MSTETPALPASVEDERPKVPAHIVGAIQLYGDARADEGDSGPALRTVLKDLRDWAAALSAAAVPDSEPTVPVPQVMGWSGGGSPEGAHGRIWVRLGDDGPDVGYIKAPDAAAVDVLNERSRQVEQEGWTPEHDNSHGRGALAAAAACYALNAMAWLQNPNVSRDKYRALSPIDWRTWPCAEKWWKPSSERRDLVKAGALILAEIERLDRAALSAAPSPQQEKP